ncbi:T9SS type A sorting domain-containing protein [Algibacter miyuki]|uniref:T9SS type A sorting domain-containing protein n=1 Tax=Algibacter miyuki TaxID=1306933 RepID=A0ABV5GWQ2_9FLAO|nr:T9SS type A sorting domain-containing protein [Algibacter miyuki]MDN3664322.1 T9SS type A sorting domain-containing protein [Algibacter miyuki]
MKHKILLFISLFICITNLTAQQIHQESFEGTSGYTTSVPFQSIGSDHFNRLTATTWNTQGNWGNTVMGNHGSYYIGIEDHDGAVLVTGEQWVKLDPVNISGASDLKVKIRLAAPRSEPGSIRYEVDDYVIVECRIDGAAYAKLGEFRGVPSNGFYHDVNLDGATGFNDDVLMNQNMADITYDLNTILDGSFSGSTIEIRVRFSLEGSHEEVAFDDIRIDGTASACSISALSSGTQTACDSGTNTYTQQVTVTYSTAPASGTLLVNGQSFAITSSPQTVTLVGLESDGNAVDVSASFSEDAACTLMQAGLFTAPANCEPPCNISSIVAGNQSACSGSSNKYAQEVTVTYSYPPASGTLDIAGQSFAITSSPQTVLLTNLDADGNAVDITAAFSADSGCSLVVNGLFTAPASCASACTFTTIVSQGFEAADYTGYTTSTPFFNDGVDTFSRGTDADFTFDITGEEGTNYIGMEDVTGEQWLELDVIDITRVRGMSVKLKLAAPNTIPTRYEETDHVTVEYQLDGAGAYVKIGEFRGIPGGGSFYHDVNLNGVTGTGDDVQMTGTMADIVYDLDNLSGFGVSGTSIKIRVRFSLEDSQEEVAFDDIQLVGMVLDDASFSYDDSSYCENGSDTTPTITGEPGGTFTSTAGLNINGVTGTIDVSESTVGTYDVVYTTTGNCSYSETVSVTIESATVGICSTLDTNDVVLNDQVLLYPNPVTDGFIIINNKSNNVLNKAVVFDILGKEVQVFQLKNSTDNETLSLSNIQSGVYLLKIYSEDSSVTKKLIIN